MKQNIVRDNRNQERLTDRYKGKDINKSPYIRVVRLAT